MYEKVDTAKDRFVSVSSVYRQKKKQWFDLKVNVTRAQDFISFLIFLLVNSLKSLVFL